MRRSSRRFGQKASSDDKRPGTKDARDEESKFRSVGDELQTDETFDHDIVERMGARIYDEVFVPAIDAAREEGKKYETFAPIRRGGELTISVLRGQ